MSKTIIKPAYNVGLFLVKLGAELISTTVMVADETRKGLKKEFKHLRKVDKRSVGKNLSRKTGKRNVKRLRS